MPDHTMDSTLSWPVLPKSDTGSTTLIRVDEPDTRLLKRLPQGRQNRPSRLRSPSLELADRDRTDLGRPRQIILGPVDQGTGSTALGWSHSDCIA
jgi:hypothetical protein